jgi:hypothetical protein
MHRYINIGVSTFNHRRLCTGACLLSVGRQTLPGTESGLVRLRSGSPGRRSGPAARWSAPLGASTRSRRPGAKKLHASAYMRCSMKQTQKNSARKTEHARRDHSGRDRKGLGLRSGGRDSEVCCRLVNRLGVRRSGLGLTDRDLRSGLEVRC